MDMRTALIHLPAAPAARIEIHRYAGLFGGDLFTGPHMPACQGRASGVNVRRQSGPKSTVTVFLRTARWDKPDAILPRRCDVMTISETCRQLLGRTKCRERLSSTVSCKLESGRRHHVPRYSRKEANELLVSIEPTTGLLQLLCASTTACEYILRVHGPENHLGARDAGVAPKDMLEQARSSVAVCAVTNGVVRLQPPA